MSAEIQPEPLGQNKPLRLTVLGAAPAEQRRDAPIGRWIKWGEIGQGKGKPEGSDQRIKEDVNDVALSSALTSLGPPNVLVGHRIIRPGDENALLPGERVTFRPSAPEIYRQSGAARIAARRLLGVSGFSDVVLPRSLSGSPVWPAGVVGSLAHDDSVAVAAIASSREFSALGIDVEPADPLPPELITLVATPTERRCYPADIIESRILFVIKEAIYKALSSFGGPFLDFQDVEVDLYAGRGRTRNGQTIAIAFTNSPRVVAMAFDLARSIPSDRHGETGAAWLTRPALTRRSFNFQAITEQ